MGGNALRAHGAVRKNRDDFERITREVLAAMPGIAGSGRFALIPGYREKTSFGDADILLENVDLETANVGGRPAWFARLADRFGAGNAVYLNKPVYGFLYDGLQVDIITVPVGTTGNAFGVALDYYSWNDLGNLVGRIAHKMGFKYGHRGLTYPVRGSDTHVLADLLVSTDTTAILRFLGYSEYDFKRGFNSLLSIWQFAASSVYFSPRIYKFDQVNSKARVRDVKRPTYTGFLQWCDRQPAESITRYDWSNSENEKPYHLQRAFKFFDGFRDAFDTAHAEHVVKQANSAAFNGDIVADITGLSGKELGQLMRQCRQHPWAHIAATYSKEQLRAYVADEFAKYRGSGQNNV